MATSGQIDFSVSAREIIIEALELLGVLGEGEEPTDAQITSSMRTLNMIVKMWQADGLNIFAVKKTFLFLERGKRQYRLDALSGDHYTSQMYQTAVAQGETAGNTSVTLQEAAQATLSSKVGIYLTSGEMVWFGLTGGPVGNVIELDSPLPADVDEGALVYFYNTPANRPMKVLEGYLHQHGGTDIPVDIFSRKQYNELSDKDSHGQVLQAWFDPQVGTSYLNVWPTASDERDYLVLFVQRTLENFDSEENTPDYPQEWYMPLASYLAMSLSPKYGTPRDDFVRIERMAMAFYQTAKEYDAEWGQSVYYEPDFMSRGR